MPLRNRNWEGPAPKWPVRSIRIRIRNITWSYDVLSLRISVATTPWWRINRTPIFVVVTPVHHYIRLYSNGADIYMYIYIYIYIYIYLYIYIYIYINIYIFISIYIYIYKYIYIFISIYISISIIIFNNYKILKSLYIHMYMNVWTQIHNGRVVTCKYSNWCREVYVRVVWCKW